MHAFFTRNFLKLHVLFHYICYYTAWLLGVKFVVAGKGLQATWVVLGCTSLQVIWQYLVQKRTHGLLFMVFILTFAGFVVDSSFLRAGLIFFHNNPWAPSWSPPWMVSLWVSFAVTYYAVMERLWSRYWLSGFLSLFAFPLVYYMGIKMGVGLLPLGLVSLMFYGLVWAVLLPVCDYVYQRSGV